MSTSDEHLTVVLETSKDAYTVSAVCWYLAINGADSHHHPRRLMTVLNAREMPGRPRRKLILMANGEGSIGMGADPDDAEFHGDTVRYAVHTSPPLSTDGRPEAFRTVTLRGPDSAIKDLVQEALDGYTLHVTEPHEHAHCVVMWQWDEDAEAWEKSKPKRCRPLTTLFLDKEACKLLRDFNRFISAESLEKYWSMHVSPTRVYMLHGVPGSGKTSLVHCIASESGCGIAMFTFTPSTTDADVKAAMASLPPRCLLCIEDIDCLFVEGRKMAASTSAMTFSGLLAALDGCGDVTGGEGIPVFLTTNRLCTLDPALRRRVDYILEFTAATRAQAQAMFERYYPGSALFEQFWQAVRARQPSMCDIQKQLIRSLNCGGGDPLADLGQFEKLISRDINNANMYM